MTPSPRFCGGLAKIADDTTEIAPSSSPARLRYQQEGRSWTVLQPQAASLQCRCAVVYRYRAAYANSIGFIGLPHGRWHETSISFFLTS